MVNAGHPKNIRQQPSVISLILLDDDDCIRTFYRATLPFRTVITSEREARSEFLLIYTKNLSMSGRPAGTPAGRPAVVTLLGGL